MPRFKTLTAILLVSMLATGWAQSAPNPDWIPLDNVRWQDAGVSLTFGASTLDFSSATVTGLTLGGAFSFTGTSWSIDPTGAISWSVDNGTDNVVQIDDDTGRVWLDLDLDATDILRLTQTAGTDIAIGNSTGDVDLLSDAFQLTLTQGGATAGLITDGTVNLLSIDLSATDLITLGDPGDNLTLDGSAITVTAAGVLAMTGVGSSSVTITSGDLLLKTSTSGAVQLDSAGMLNFDAAANLDIDITGTYDMLATGTVNISGTGNSLIDITSGNLSLQTVTSGDIGLLSAAGISTTAAGLTDINANLGFDLDATGAASAISSTSQNLTIETITSGALSVTSAGTLALSSTDWAVSTVGDMTGIGAITADGTADVKDLTVDAGSGIDTQAAGALLVGASTATSVEIADAAILTDIQGTLQVADDTDFTETGGSSGSADFDVAGYAEFAGTTEFNGILQADGVARFGDDLDWDANAIDELITIDSTDVLHTQGLVTITDLRAGVNNDTTAEASLRVVASGTYGAHFADGNVFWSEEADLEIEETGGADVVTVDASAQTGSGTLHIPDLAGGTLDMVVTGTTQTIAGAKTFSDTTTFTGIVDINSPATPGTIWSITTQDLGGSAQTAHAALITIADNTTEGSTRAGLRIDDNRIGTENDSSNEASLYISNAGASGVPVALYVDTGATVLSDRLSMTFTDNTEYLDINASDGNDTDAMRITMSDDTSGGPGNVNALLLDDNRDGTEADANTEATLQIDAVGTGAFALYVVDGAVEFSSNAPVDFKGTTTFSGGQTRKAWIPASGGASAAEHGAGGVYLDSVNPPTVVVDGTAGQSEMIVLGFDSDGGATGDDYVYIDWMVPDGYVVDSARLNVVWFHPAAETASDAVVFDCTVNAVGSAEDFDVAGTAFTEGAGDTTTNGTADLVRTYQMNIEVEDIAVGDLVHIAFFVDESASAMTGLVHVIGWSLEWESTE